MKGSKMLNLIKNLTPTQWIIIFISTAGFLNASTAQLTEWFGPKVAHDIISGLGFAQGLIGTWAMALNTQGAQIASVQSIATGPSSSIAVSAQKALLQATSAIASDKSIPTSEDAKNTLIAATIALPEVQTIITDKKTADASSSSSVVSAT
jgi:hypothetical protein